MMSDVMTKPHQLIASDRVEGTAVRRPNGDRIGHIERLMIDKISGKVSYAILSFGGFLGMGTNLLPLPWARLSYNPKFEAYELDIDDDELRRAPSFRGDKDFDWGDRSQEAELHRYYGIPPYWGGFLSPFENRASAAIPQTVCRARLSALTFRGTRRSSSVAMSKMHTVNWNSGRLGGFHPDNFLIRENPYVSEIYDSRPGWVSVAGDRRVCAKPDGNHRPRQHGAGRCVRLVVPGQLACVETRRPQRLQ